MFCPGSENFHVFRDHARTRKFTSLQWRHFEYLWQELLEAYLFTLSSVNFLKTSLNKCLLTVLHDISVNTQTK